jgi:drug/metabolite transporter (DMT)-like permease
MRGIGEVDFYPSILFSLMNMVHASLAEQDFSAGGCVLAVLFVVVCVLIVLQAQKEHENPGVRPESPTFWGFILFMALLTILGFAFFGGE